VPSEELCPRYVSPLEHAAALLVGLTLHRDHVPHLTVLDKPKFTVDPLRLELDAGEQEARTLEGQYVGINHAASPSHLRGAIRHIEIGDDQVARRVVLVSVRFQDGDGVSRGLHPLAGFQAQAVAHEESDVSEEHERAPRDGQIQELASRVLVPLYCTNIQYFGDNGPMENVPATLWIAACAHRLQQQWHTVDPLELEDVARDLWRDERLRAMAPDEAAVDWLRPITE